MISGIFSERTYRTFTRRAKRNAAHGVKTTGGRKLLGKPMGGLFLLLQKKRAANPLILDRFTAPFCVTVGKPKTNQ
jgi:hypothetical protein